MNLIPPSVPRHLLLLAILVCWTPNQNEARRNVALQKPASQKNTDWGGYALRAVDGNKTPGYFVANSCTHTSSGSSNWWMVDLQKHHVISAIEITNRDSSASGRLSNFIVEISKAHPSGLAGFPGVTSSPVCAREPGQVPGAASFYYRCPEPILGRFLRVVKLNTSPLTICEFEAYEPGLWGFRKEQRPNGVPTVLETFTETRNVTECVHLCMRHSGYRCKHVQVNRLVGTCRLLRSFKFEDSVSNDDWDLYTVIID